MVTAPHHLAAQAGLDVLRDGGNAVEACVAVAATLAAVYPHMTGIGGDGFWLVREPDGRVHSVHGCGGAAAKADLALYAGHDAVPTRGPLAANTVAGTISGWAAALAETGSALPLARLLRDAIRYAEEGVAVTAGGAAIATSKGGELRTQPGAYGAIFEPEGRPLCEGDLLRQPALAQTLRRLVDEGLESFYTGALAVDIAADLEALGSPVSAADLAAHKATRPEPLHAQIRGAWLYNSAPPTQGFASLMILALFDRLAADEADGFAHVHGLVEATKQAFLLRDRLVGDPAYMNVALQPLFDDPGIIGDLAAAIDSAHALPWPQPPFAGDTCWFGAADSEGRVVSCIQSTYFEFGSGVVLPGTGITWQNRGSSFRLMPEGWNALRPGRKPFHTLNPRSPASTTAASWPMERWAARASRRRRRRCSPAMPAMASTFRKRSRARGWLLGRTWGAQSTTLKIEDGFDEALYAGLAAAGHDVERVGALTAMMGHAGAIVRHPDGALEGATDPRSDGGVATW